MTTPIAAIVEPQASAMLDRARPSIDRSVGTAVRSLRLLVLIAATTTLAVAASIRDGTYHTAGIMGLTAALVLVGLLMALSQGRREDDGHDEAAGDGCALQRSLSRRPKLAWLLTSESTIAVAMAIAIALQFSQAMEGVLRRYFHGHRTSELGLPLAAGVGVLALALLHASSSRRVRNVVFPFFLLVLLLLGVWFLSVRNHPAVDVAMFGKDSSAALLRLENPYAITFPNPYSQDSPWYGPGVSVDGVLQFGYPYMPLTLLMITPMRAITGDFRAMQLFAMLVSALLIAHARPSRVSFLAAVMFLMVPRSYYLVEGGWTEPLQVLLLCATVFCAIRVPKLMPYVLGLLLVSKQYMPFAVALTPLLFRAALDEGLDDYIKSMMKAVVIGSIVTLPIVLWNLPAFMNSAVTLQLRQPFRWDSVSYLAWWVQTVGRPTGWMGMSAPAHPPSAAWAFLAMAAFMAVALWRCARTPSGFALAVAVTYLGFFAFNKQAFCNYYLLVIGAMCCAIGTMQGVPGTAPARE